MTPCQVLQSLQWGRIGAEALLLEHCMPAAMSRPDAPLPLGGDESPILGVSQADPPLDVPSLPHCHDSHSMPFGFEAFGEFGAHCSLLTNSNPRKA